MTEGDKRGDHGCVGSWKQAAMPIAITHRQAIAAIDVSLVHSIDDQVIDQDVGVSDVDPVPSPSSDTAPAIETPPRPDAPIGQFFRGHPDG